MTAEKIVQHDILAYLNPQEVREFATMDKDTIHKVLYKHTSTQIDAALTVLYSNEEIQDREGRIKMGMNGEKRHEQLSKLVASQVVFTERVKAWLKRHWIVNLLLKGITAVLIFLLGASTPIVTDMLRSANPINTQEYNESTEPKKAAQDTCETIALPTH